MAASGAPGPEATLNGCFNCGSLRSPRYAAPSCHQLPCDHGRPAMWQPVEDLSWRKRQITAAPGRDQYRCIADARVPEYHAPSIWAHFCAPRKHGGASACSENLVLGRFVILAPAAWI